MAQTGYTIIIEGLLDHFMEILLNKVKPQVSDNSFELHFQCE